MVELVSFEESMERLVRFVEETTPDTIVEQTVELLDQGESAKRLLKAAGLAVSRSTELPSSHHGGPIHPIAGLYSTFRLSERLEGRDAFMPTLQSVALANRHIHSPEMGPAAMVAIDADDLLNKDVQDLTQGFESALRNRSGAIAEKHLLALLAVASRDQILEALLQIAIPRNALDDHYFLYVVCAFRALDAIGWDHASVILRPTVRFLVRHPMMEHGDDERGRIIGEGVALYLNYADLEGLVDGHGIAPDTIEFETGPEESDAIDRLAQRIAMAAAITEAPRYMAAAMIEGLSIMGTLEAASIGGARRFMRSNSGNPFDVHLQTGINARRYLLGCDGLSRRTKLLALLSWGYGYEVRHIDRTLHWSLESDAAVPESGAEHDQDEMLAAITASIAKQPILNLDQLEESIAVLVAPDSVRETIALTAYYIALGHDADALFARLAELVCHDDQSEMHAYKEQQTAHEEYHATREAFRAVHLLAAVKHMAVIGPIRPQNIYARVRSSLNS